VNRIKISLEKVLIAIISLSLVAVIASTLILTGFSMTKDEAIEISRNSNLVRNWLKDADHYFVDAFYMNSTEVNKALDEFPGLRDVYPGNRSIWVVTWDIHPAGAPSAFYYCGNHVIDDETGRILFEGTASLR